MRAMITNHPADESSRDHDLSTFAGRLNWALDAAQVSRSALARRVGTSPQAISHLCQPDNGAQGSVHTTNIALALQVDSHWLASGRGHPGWRTLTANPSQFSQVHLSMTAIGLSSQEYPPRGPDYSL